MAWRPQKQSLKIVGVIPARLHSTRLGEKVLLSIDGRPMIQHVWERAKASEKLQDLIIACDHPRIENCAREFGAKVMMTDSRHSNGTSRVSEVAERVDADVFINLQADEPMLSSEAVDRLAEVFEEEDDIQVATLGVRLKDREAYENPNVVKVVCNRFGDALYFSRAPIPFYRQKDSVEFSCLKHLGIYGYRRDFLFKIISWPQSDLENKEKLEQLRILENGYPIRVVETAYDSVSVDTQDDLEKVKELIRQTAQRSGVLPDA